MQKVPNSGPVKFSQIKTVFQKAAKVVKETISSYYGVQDDVPSTGPIKWSDFMNKYLKVAHKYIFSASGDYRYDIPPGVTHLDLVLIGAGGGGGAGSVTWTGLWSGYNWWYWWGYNWWSEYYGWYWWWSWYPNIAGGGGGGSGEVIEKQNLNVTGVEYLNLTVGDGGKGAAKVVYTSNVGATNKGSDGTSTVLRYGTNTITAHGGKGGSSAGSWHWYWNWYYHGYWYDNYDWWRDNHGWSLADWQEYRQTVLVAGGDGGSASVGSGWSGTYFNGFSNTDNYTFSWNNFVASTTEKNVNSGTVHNTGTYARYVGFGGAGGGNSYSKGGDSGVTNTEYNTHWNLWFGHGIDIITDDARKGKLGSGGSGGHSAGGYWGWGWSWWDGYYGYFDNSQGGADGGDGYVKIKRWWYKAATDNYFQIPSNVTSIVLKFYAQNGSLNKTETMSVTPTELIRIVVSGVDGEHSFVQRETAGIYSTHHEGTASGGKETISLEV